MAKGYPMSPPTDAGFIEKPITKFIKTAPCRPSEMVQMLFRTSDIARFTDDFRRRPLILKKTKKGRNIAPFFRQSI